MSSESVERNVASDEIDLTELLRKVVETRVWVLVALVVFTIAYWAFQASVGLVKPPLITYETRINLQFKGADEGEYPNESPFTINDLIAPVVLATVYESSGIAEYVSLENFQSGFSVRPYAADRQMILGKYSEQLARKNLSSAEIEQLQEGIRGELDLASRGSIALSFSGAFLEGVPRTLVSEVVRRVPQEWARHMVEEVGVSDIRESMYSRKVLEETDLGDMDYLIAFELLLDRLELLQSNIEVLKELPNGVVIEDDVTGLSLPDLEKAISDVKRYRVAPLVNPVRSLGIAKSPELVQLYFENELIELGRELAVLKTKKVNISDAYSSYLQTKTSGKNGASLDAGSTVTIEPEFFDKLVELTNSGADITYRQELNTKFLEAADRLSDVEAEIERINQILNSMKGQNSATQALRESYSDQVNQQLPEIIGLLVKYFGASQRMYSKLSVENLGRAEEMFRFLDGEVDQYATRLVLSLTNVRLYLILCFLLTVIVVPLVMVARAVKKEG